MKNKLFQLLARNKGAGSFKVEASGDEATLWVYDVIVDSDATAEWWGGVSAESLVKQLRGLTASTINIRINSPGGDVFAARAIEQAIRDHSATVIAHVDGYAASAASLIAVAADKAIMAPGTFMMIHKAWTFAMGNADELFSTASLLEKIDGTIQQSYEAKAGDKAKGQDFGALMAAETWFTPEEAVAAGLADEIASSAPKAQAQPAWDMSAYDHAPTARAPQVEEPEVPEEPEAPEPPAKAINHRARALRLVSKTA
jgi:ATP-dependent Clp protease, protease subunit